MLLSATAVCADAVSSTVCRKSDVRPD